MSAASLFALDLRSLALFRLGCGLLLLADVAQRSLSLEAFTSNQGCLPAWWASQNAASPWWIGLHYLNPTPGYAALLHALLALAALGLALGWRSRLCCAVCWLLLCSLHSRNPLILGSGDTLLRMLLLFAAFLPLDACLSWRHRRWTPSTSPRFFHLAGACLILQVAAAHAFSSFGKTGPAWWSGGNAVDLLLANPTCASALGLGIGGSVAPLSPLLSPAVPIAEFAGALLLLGGERARLLGLSVLALPLAATLLLLDLGLAGLVPGLALLALLPSRVWQKSPPRPEEKACGLSQALFLGATLSLVVGTNLLGLVAPTSAAARALGVPANLLRVDQSWAVWSPEPPAVWGYPRVVATTARGPVELTGRSVPDNRWDRARWRAYYGLLVQPGFEAHRQRFCRWLVSSHPELEIRSLELFWIETPVRPGAARDARKERSLYHGLP